MAPAPSLKHGLHRRCSDFHLRGGHGGDRDGGPLGGEEPKCFEHHECADIDPQIAGLQHFFAGFLVQQVHGGLANHTGYRTAPRQKRYPLPDEYLGVPAADRIEPEVPLVVNVHDHQADFVNVSSEHERSGALRPSRNRRKRIPVDVRADSLRKGLGLRPPAPGGAGLETRRARRIEQ